MPLYGVASYQGVECDSGHRAAVSLFCPQPHKSSTAMRTKAKAFIFTFKCSPSLPGLLMLIIP